VLDASIVGEGRHVNARVSSPSRTRDASGERWTDRPAALHRSDCQGQRTQVTPSRFARVAGRRSFSYVMQSIRPC